MTKKTQKINDYKKNAVKALKEIIEKSTDLIFTDFRGLTVAQLTDLRHKLRQEAARYKVVKNNYMQIALQEMGKPDVSDFLVGPTGVAFATRDIGPVAKIFVEFAKEAPLVLKGAIVDGKKLDQAGVDALSKLPSRQELIARLMGSLNAPATNLVLVLSAVASKLVRTLKAVADKKAEAGN